MNDLNEALVLELLNQIETLKRPKGSGEFDVDGWSDADVEYHLREMWRNGWIDCRNVRHLMGEGLTVRSITRSGQEFLER